MTCIAGIAQGGKVYIGGDSAGVAGNSQLDVRTDRKVFLSGDFVMGFTTSFRMGQLIQYAFTPPKRHPDKDVMAYMVTEFVDGLRACLNIAAVFSTFKTTTKSASRPADITLLVAEMPMQKACSSLQATKPQKTAYVSHYRPQRRMQAVCAVHSIFNRSEGPT
jgi:hypothetical protein